MAVITSQWWRRLVNAYEVKTGMVCFKCKNCMCEPYLSASEVSFSRWGAIQIYVPLPFTFIHGPWSPEASTCLVQPCCVITHADGSRVSIANIRVCVWFCLWFCLSVRTIGIRHNALLGRVGKYPDIFENIQISKYRKYKKYHDILYRLIYRIFSIFFIFSCRDQCTHIVCSCWYFSLSKCYSLFVCSTVIAADWT